MYRVAKTYAQVCGQFTALNSFPMADGSSFLDGWGEEGEPRTCRFHSPLATEAVFDAGAVFFDLRAAMEAFARLAHHLDNKSQLPEKFNKLVEDRLRPNRKHTLPGGVRDSLVLLHDEAGADVRAYRDHVAHASTLVDKAGNAACDVMYRGGSVGGCRILLPDNPKDLGGKGAKKKWDADYGEQRDMLETVHQACCHITAELKGAHDELIGHFIGNETLSEQDKKQGTARGNDRLPAQRLRQRG